MAVDSALFCRSSVLAGADLCLAEAAASQLHHGPLDLAGALSLQQPGGSSQLADSVSSVGDLLTRGLLLFVLKLTDEVLP